MTHMYKETETWNPFKGCRFDCIYCDKSFKAQAKRQKHNCMKCYNYEPHFHPERLNKIPKADLVFACGNGDIAFAKPQWILKILDKIESLPEYTFLLQTKKPSCLAEFEYIIPSNCIVGTTIETNRDTKNISKAPEPCTRFYWMMDLECKRKAVTIEPILAFDMEVMKRWIRDINPEIVWIGYANHTNGLKLDEPELSKTKKLIKELETFTDVRLKTIRDKLIFQDFRTPKS